MGAKVDSPFQAEPRRWKEPWGLWTGEAWYGATVGGFDGVLVFCGYYGACMAAAEIRKSEGIEVWPERLT